MMSKDMKINSQKKERRERIKKQAAEAADEVPPGFSHAAAKDWPTMPRETRELVWRRLLEVAHGLDKYYDAAKAYEPVRKYHEMAKQSGTTLAKAIEQYMAMEALWRSDPITGFLAVCGNFGVAPDVMLGQIAWDLPGLLADQAAQQSSATTH